MRLLRSTFPEIFISVDTFRSQVALAAAECGADIINDVFAGEFDGKMMEVVGKLKLPYLIMHMKGTPETMQKKPEYENLIKEIGSFFKKKIKEASRNSIRQLILDPGFGFGKTPLHNYKLLREMNFITQLNYPVLVGLSRKSLITRLLDISPDMALNGTTVLNTIALLNGANVLRVHDVKEAVEAIKMTGVYKSA